MATKSKFGLNPRSRDSYLERVIAFPLTSIRSDAHLTAAQHQIDAILARPSLDEGEQLDLDGLSDLVESYEDSHHAIEPASDAEMLRHLLEAKGISQAQLSRDCEIPRSTVSEILSGKRPFSRHMIRKVAAYFRVEPGVFVANRLSNQASSVTSRR